MKDFNGKVAVVTGAASGIGKALAERCLAEGMQVVMADVEQKALDESASELQASGDNNILAVTCDVSKREQVEDLARKTIDTFGAVHLLFNNAGVTAGSNVWDATYNDWEWVMGVNLWGVIYGVKTFMPIILAQDSEGHIVNTASVAGLVPGFGMATYSVTKHGVVALTENIFAHLGFNSGKVGASVLCPGFISTHIYDAARNRPAELANPDVEVTEEMQQQYQGTIAMIQAGMEPAELADIVFKGIRTKQLYIQTHDAFNRVISKRAENIVTGTNPQMGKSQQEVDELNSRRVELTEDQLGEYAGDYKRGGNTLTFSVKEGGLWFKNLMTGASWEVIPVGDHRFELMVAYESFQFVLENESATKLVSTVSGINLDWAKV